jgi:hypothetical protein
MVYSHDRRELRPSEAADAAPGAQHRLLHGVLGVVQRAEHAVGVRLELTAVGRDQALEGPLLPRLRSSEQPRVAA